MSTREDERRELALEAYGVLGTPPRPELEALVELAAKFTGVPMATVNVFTASQQWQVATYGFEPAVCDRDDSMCRYVLTDARPVLLADASLDDRFRNDPFTTGELGRVRFFASYPLVTPDGIVLGTLAVFDEQSREVDPETEQALGTLAARIVDVLQLELTSRELAAANERLGAFAGQVSHDLKNPLAGVRMSLELAVEEHGEDADLVALLARAQRSAGRMDAMIGDLLSFARFGASPRVVDVDLAASLDQVLEDLEGAVGPGQIEVVDLPVVRGDEVQLRVLLQNLVTNAVKFSPPDSPVVVAGEHLEHACRISVTDRGIGVPAEERERIFDPMVQLDQRAAGSGIGLATCSRIIEAHRGSIGLTDNPDGGSVVWFELPR